jgi:hypothetical protein
MSGWQGGAYDERSAEQRATDYRLLRWLEGVDKPGDRPSRAEVEAGGYRLVPREWMEYLTRVQAEAEEVARRLACLHGFDPACARCEWMTPFRRALSNRKGER